MKRKVWILLAIAVLLLLWRWRREGFDATPTIKKPEDIDAAEIARIKGLLTPPSPLSDAEVKEVISGFWAYSVPSQIAGEPPRLKGWSRAESQITTADLNEYLNLRSGLSTEKRNQYREILQAYYITQGQSVFQQARDYVSPGPTGGTGSTGATTPGTVERPSSASQELRQEIATTAGIAVNNDTLIGYFLTQVQRFYDTVYLPDKRVPTLASITAFADGVDTSSYPSSIKNNFKTHLVEIIETYFQTAPIIADQGTIAGPTGGAGQQLGGGTGGTAAPQSPGYSSGAGASSGQRPGQSSFAGVSGYRLFGPRFEEYGAPVSSNGGGGGLGPAGQFPEVLGGREPGYQSATGGTGPSLPSSASLGADLGSMFLPFSRIPGDLDRIPDPFRAMNNFSLASYTPKTDPVPFLPDFSAFQR